MRAERVPHLAGVGWVRRRRRNQDVILAISFGEAVLGNLLFQIARGFDDRLAGHNRRAAARFADRVRAAVGVAPNHGHFR